MPYFTLQIPCKRCLLLLGTTTARLLSSLNGLLVAGSRATLHGRHEVAGGLEGALEVARGGLAIDVDLDKVALEHALDGDDALDQKRVGVLHVEVHESHHGNSHELAAEGSLELAKIVGVDRGSDELALLAGAHGGRLDVLEGGHVCKKTLVSRCRVRWRRRCVQRAGLALQNQRSILHTLLGVNLGLDVQVDEANDDVAGNVNGANGVEDILVVEGNLLRDLHHTKDDEEVGAAISMLAFFIPFRCNSASFAAVNARVMTALSICAEGLPGFVVRGRFREGRDRTFGG